MTSAPPFVLSVLDPPGAGDRRPDTLGVDGVQVGAVTLRRLSMHTLIMLRGAFLTSQMVILLMVWLVLRWPFPPLACSGLIAAAAIVNLVLALSPAARRQARPWEITGLLAFDVLQLTGLLYLTGGVVNPFALLLIAPVTVAGGALPPRHALALCVLAVGAALVLTQAAAPPPWSAAPAGHDAYRYGRSVALVVAMGLASAYASWSSANGARRELALHVTETVLAREQRLSALGALAAAVAHELGTPLATISIIATEMAREAPAGPLRDDAVLLVEQARRCRDILRRLAETPEQPDAVHERMSLLQFVAEIVEPHAGAGGVRVEGLVSGPPGMVAPDLWRRPEILLAVSTIVENAVDFATSEILVTARFDASNVTVEVRDDGPGFALAILPRLGEPYVTSRPGSEGLGSGHVGMGLGLFIAKTLLERSGARVAFANGPGGGAIATARWSRSRVEITGRGPCGPCKTGENSDIMTRSYRTLSDGIARAPEFHRKALSWMT